LKSTASRPEVVIVFIRELWPQIVGAELARNSEPVQLHGRTLVVRVEDAVWKSQLETLRALMIRAVNNQWGCVLIERIQIRLRPK
jgi:hypothetical protein